MVLIVPVMHIWRDCNQNCTAIHWVPQLMYCTVPVHCSRCCTCDAYMMRLYPELYSYPRGPPTSAPRLPLWPGATHYTHHNNNKNQLWGEWGGGEKQVFFLTVCLYIFFKTPLHHLTLIFLGICVVKHWKVWKCTNIMRESSYFYCKAWRFWKKNG